MRKAEKAWYGLWTAIVLGFFAAAISGQTLPTTRPSLTPHAPVIYVKPHSADNLVLHDLLIKIDPPGSQPNGILIHGGNAHVTIRNCTVIGAGYMGIDVSAGFNPYLTIENCTVRDCTPGKPADCSGIYLAGIDSTCTIHNNLILNNGWWAGFNVNDPAQRAQLGRNHGVYWNESGSADGAVFAGNIVLDNAGSQIGCRMGADVSLNVFRAGFDWDLIVGQFGKSAAVSSNAHFGPRIDAPPYWGGGTHLLCPGKVTNDYFAGSAKTTNNVTAVDAAGKLVPQLGYWPKPGGTGGPRPAGTPVPTLEAYYGSADVYSAIRPGDAAMIVNWLSLAGQHGH